MKIIKADVFDPALSGEDILPARLELLVSGVDADNPSYVDVGDEFTVIHYSHLMKIFSDRPDWDDEDTEKCAVIFNSSSEAHKWPVFPVTVSVSLNMWEVYYMRVDRIRKILENNLSLEEYGYEILPDPTWAIEFKHGWYIQHKSRECVYCFVDVNDGIAGASLNAGDPVEIHPHRLACLCVKHKAEYNAKAYAARKCS